jgi:hypothetical protein
MTLTIRPCLNPPCKFNFTFEQVIPEGIIEAFLTDNWIVIADGKELKLCERILNDWVLCSHHVFIGEKAKEIILNWNRYALDVKNANISL